MNDNGKSKKIKTAFVICIIVTACVTAFFIIYAVPFFNKTIADWGNSEILSTITMMGVLVAFSVPFIGGRYQKKIELERREYEENFQKKVELERRQYEENFQKKVELERRQYEEDFQKKMELERREYEEGKKEENFKSLYQIDIHVTVLENRTVLFSASIENVGDKTIITKSSNLYIDEGIEDPKGSKIDIGGKEEVGAIYYDFPFILQHRKNVKNRPDCVLCIKCRDEKDYKYPIDEIEERFKNKKLYYANILLRHLSDESIQYIYPKEKFSEDVILQFKKSGVYRVTFIVTTDGESDCECATKQFYIP